MLSFINSKTNVAHERIEGSEVITMRAVGVFSNARRKRNHHDEIIRRTYLGVTSAKLSASRPKPPLCSKRSVALKARSRLLLQRTHNKRSKSTRAFAADKGSKV